MRTLGVKWPRVVGVTRIPEIDRAMAGKGHAVTAVARRQNTVEHINAALNGYAGPQALPPARGEEKRHEVREAGG